MASSNRSTIDVRNYPKLDDKQAGHLRHYRNLVSQPDGDWHYFGTADAHEEFDDAKRYQLATMTYAMGVAHYHRLPALRGAFHTLMRKAIHKMLLREVWSYWFTSSHGGRVFDPDIETLRKPWADPVTKENIMYSGHLLLMTSLYAMLFDDDEFEKPGSIELNWNPLFWGLGNERFVYDNRSLAQVILKQMQENDWLGVCCEPNAIFVVCNQFPLVALRYNDSRDGTNRVEDEILPKYRAALKEKGMINDDGLYASFFAVRQMRVVPSKHGAHTAWANAFMNAWNSDFIRASYEKQTLGFLTDFGGQTRLQPTRVAQAFRSLVIEHGYDAGDYETLIKAREESKEVQVKIPFETLNWLGFTMMLSELGKEKELNDLLDYADKKLNPTWANGGLFYPRNQELMDDEWNYTHVEPHSGNSGIGYARLNVVNGQKTMWENPWTSEQLAGRPWIDGDGYDHDIDFLRGVWDDKNAAMIITLRRWRGEPAKLTLKVNNLPRGRYDVILDNHDNHTVDASQTGVVVVEAHLGMSEVNVVVQQLKE